MKKLYVMLFILLLSSCDRKINVEFINGVESKIYAYNIVKEEIEEIYIDYEINDYNDTFILCSNYQNYLPINYSFMGTNCVTLNKSYIKDNNVYYHVDTYIYYCDDINIFIEIMSKINNELGYNKTFLVVV